MSQEIDEQGKQNEFEHRLARIMAVGGNDGKGDCKFCGLQLTETPQGLEHWPARCSPPAECTRCGVKLVQRDGSREWLEEDGKPHICTGTRDPLLSERRREWAKLDAVPEVRRVHED